jgi:enoyl-CoA hydratase/carnithine racemase
MGNITVERRGRVAVVRFDRGNRANALSYALMRELTEVARSFEDDLETSAIVLTGRSDVFTLGFDLRDPESAPDGDLGLSERRRAVRVGPRMCAAWEAIDAFTIVAIEGYCVGGGAALSVSCDLRVMGESAVMYVPEVERGMNMSWGSVPRFVNLIGPSRTKSLVALATKVGAAQAVQWGLADELAPTGGALERALVLAERAASLPPVALRMIKRDVDVAAKALNHAVSFMDADQFALAQSSEDYRESIGAFFEKRDPKFTGR